ncbi:MAG: Diacylglycerol kinase [Phycisphaerae bacterium]|nr:Diacylglycerol kinase [Phycisphaerae bacterium]
MSAEQPAIHPGHYRLIVNPQSGSGRRRQLIALLESALRRRGHEVRVLPTQHAGHATLLAAELPAEVTAVIAVGGDGTFREVAAGLLDRPTPLALWPAGTENLAAKHLGYRANIAELIHLLETAPVEPIDAAICNGQPFFVIGGVGFDAEVVQRVSKERRGHISRWTYFWPIWKTFWNHRFPAIRVVADGTEFFRGRGIAFVGLMPRYALNLPITPTADCRDGLLDLCIMPCASRLTLARHSLRTFLRLPFWKKDVIYRQVRDIRIEPDEPQVLVQLDGDNAGILPAHFISQPHQLRILRPATPDQAAKVSRSRLRSSTTPSAPTHEAAISDWA